MVDEAGPEERPKLPGMFWVYLVFLVLFVVFAIVQALIVRSAGTTFMAVAVLGTMALIGLVLAAFASSVVARQRRARQAFPGAVVMPVVVGRDLGLESSRLSEILVDRALKLRSSTYAALAFDRDGLHLVSSPGRSPGTVPAARVKVAGTATTVIGTRTAPCLMLTVETERGTVPLPVVPMRLRNPVRLFSASELRRIAQDLEAALAGRSVAPGWLY